MFGLFRAGFGKALEANAGNKMAVEDKLLAVFEGLYVAGNMLVTKSDNGVISTTYIIGLAENGFFADMPYPLTDADNLTFETTLGGIGYKFNANLLGRVEFLDQLPALKFSYPEAMETKILRDGPRKPVKGTVSVSLREPFRCDAPVRELGLEGLTFEYKANLGKLKRDDVIEELTVELPKGKIIKVKAQVLGTIVVCTGPQSLPCRYRSSVKFLNLNDVGKIGDYLSTLGAQG